MAEYLLSLSREDLIGLTALFIFLTGFIAYISVSTALHNLSAHIYCRIRQRKPRMTRCYFWDCPTWENCPYNATPPNKKQSFKEWLQSWRKKGGDDNA